MKKIYSRILSALKRAWIWYKAQFVGRPWWRKALAGFLSFILFFVFIYYYTWLNLLITSTNYLTIVVVF